MLNTKYYFILEYYMNSITNLKTSTIYIIQQITFYASLKATRELDKRRKVIIRGGKIQN